MSRWQRLSLSLSLNSSHHFTLAASLFCSSYHHIAAAKALSLNSCHHVMLVFLARVWQRLVAEDACFRMRITLELVLIRFRVCTKCVQGHPPEWFWNGPELAGSWESRQDVLGRLVCGLLFYWTILTTSWTPVMSWQFGFCSVAPVTMSWPSSGPEFFVIWLLKRPASGWGLLWDSSSSVTCLY